MTAIDAIQELQVIDMRKLLHIPVATIMTLIMLLLLFIAPPLVSNCHFICPVAFAEELWKQEFMDICLNTDEAASFSKDELKVLLQRGEKLKLLIDALEETPRKVYLKRLQMCMNLYAFVLESKEAENKQ